MAKKFPLHPKHPERICWGCDKYCPTDSLQCGNGSGRTQHPAELLGDDWYAWGDWGIEVEDGGAAGAGEKTDESMGAAASEATGKAGEAGSPADADGEPPLPAPPSSPPS